MKVAIANLFKSGAKEGVKLADTAQAGIGIVKDGKLTARAVDMTGGTSHQALAEGNKALIEAPTPGVAYSGKLVEGAEAVTFTVKNGELKVAGSLNFTEKPSESAVDAVKKFLEELQKANNSRK